MPTWRKTATCSGGSTNDRQEHFRKQKAAQDEIQADDANGRVRRPKRCSKSLTQTRCQCCTGERYAGGSEGAEPKAGPPSTGEQARGHSKNL